MIMRGWICTRQPVVGQDFPDYWDKTVGGWQLKTDNSGTPIDFAARALAMHSAGIQVTCWKQRQMQPVASLSQPREVGGG